MSKFAKKIDLAYLKSNADKLDIDKLQNVPTNLSNLTTEVDKLEKIIENITKSYSNFAPTFVDHHLLPDMNFNGHYLIDSILVPKKLMNLYISYSLSPWLKYLNTDFTLNSCLFGSGKLTKNRDSDKYKYSGYNIGFDS